MTDGAPLITTSGGDSDFSVRVNTKKVESVIARVPKVAHFWLQGFLHRSFVLHRLEWLRRKGVRFGRRSGQNSLATQVFKINEGPETPGPSDVIYRVHPKEQRAASTKAAIEGLQNMRAEAFAGSIILRIHEFGEDVRASRGWMAIPIKTRPDSPKRWEAANPDKRLEWRPSKKFPGEGVLYEIRKGRRGPGRPKKGGTPTQLRERLRLRFVLKREVDMKPTLGFYGTWENLRGVRDTLWAGAADKMIQQMREFDPRDV